MGLLKRLKQYRNFEKLINTWEGNLPGYKGRLNRFKPRNKIQFMSYGVIQGKIKIIEDALRMLDE